MDTRTGRSLSVEEMDLDSDGIWGGMIKTFLLTAVGATLAFALIPLLLQQRLPNESRARGV